MKVLLLVIISLNLAFYFFTNLDKTSEEKLPHTEKDIPPITILNSGSADKGILITPDLHREMQAKPVSAKAETIIPQKVPSSDAKAQASNNAVTPQRKETVATLGNSNSLGLSGANSCVALGPFVDKDDAHELNEKLIEMNVDSELKSIREKEQFWVYIEGKTLKASLENVTAVLKQKDIRYKITKDAAGQDLVDFGWYKTEVSATQRLKQLRALGYMPRMNIKGSKGEQIWVNYTLPRGKKLSEQAKKVIYETRKEIFLQQKSCASSRG